MEKLTNFIVKYRWVVLAVILLLTIFFGFQLKSLKVDSNLVDSLPKNDSVVKTFKEVGKQFGGNEMGMIILNDKNILKPEALNDIRKITDTLSEMKGVASVTSLTNIMNLKVKGDNFQINKLINNDNWPDNQQRADSLKKEILTNKIVAGNLISRDGSSTLIIFTFQDGTNTLKVSQTIKNKIGRLHLHEKYYFAGSPFMTNYVSDVISNDLITLIPISFLLIALILFLSFRSLRGVVLPLLTAGFATIWAMGIFVMLGFKLSMVSNNVPIIILAVGSAYAIHVLNRVNQCKEKDFRKAIAKALSLITVPVILAALTTMVGFLSFIFGSYLTMIRDFGLLAALGTFLSALLALIFVPAVLAIWPEKAKGKVPIASGNKGSKITRYVLLPLYKMVSKYRYAVLLVWIILFTVSITGIFMIKRNVSVSKYFKKNNPASIAERIINEKFGGNSPVFVVFKGNMQEPAVLKAMFKMEKFLKNNPNITGTQSIADIVAQLNQDMGGKDIIPDNKRMIEQLWFLINQQGSLNRLVTSNQDEGIIIAKFNGGNNIKAFKQDIQNYIAEHPSKSYSVQVTGMPFINAELNKSLVRSQLASVAIAIILIIGIVSLMVSSFIKGLFASLPILATLTILFGIMGWTGIPLNIVTVLVASIAMGIGIDYSIHFISHFNHSKKQYQDVLPAIEETFMVSGKAIIINFISVSAGFLVLIFSELVPMIYFGFLIAFSMFSSALGTLTLLPAIILIGNKKFVTQNKIIKTMKIKVLLIVLGGFLLFPAKSYAQNPMTAKNILAKTDQISSAIQDKKAHVKMVMVNLKKNKEKVKKAILFQKGTNKTLFRYVYPKADSGIAFLRLPNHQIYIYLSLFKKAKRITNLANSVYNNSDFSFQDMSSNSFSAKYFPRLIKTNDTAYILKLTPKTKNDTYQYVIATINKKFYYPEKLEYFNRKGEKIKQENFHFIKVNGIWVSREVDMINLDKKHMTKVIMSDIKVNTGLKNEIFTVKNLENKPLNDNLVKK